MGSTTRSVATVIVVLAALLQWIIILERSGATAWQWYKTYGYGGDNGYITVGSSTQIIFFLTSTAFALLGFHLLRHSEQKRIMVLAAKIGSVSLLLGMIVWSALLLSPLVIFNN